MSKDKKIPDPDGRRHALARATLVLLAVSLLALGVQATTVETTDISPNGSVRGLTVTILSVSPNYGVRGQNVDLAVTLSGVRLHPALYKFTLRRRDAYTGVERKLDGIPWTEDRLAGVLHTKFLLPDQSEAGDISGLWDLRVESGSIALPGIWVDDDTKLNAFTLYDQLSVASITPNSGTTGTTVSSLVIQGRGFQPGATVKLTRSGYLDIPVSITTREPNRLIGSVALPADAVGGSRDVVVTNPSGATQTLTSGFTVRSVPVAAFTASTTSGPAPLVVEFTDTSTGTPTSWAWNFGDGTTVSGTTAAERNPSHTYTAVGTYTVTLTATNAGGYGDSEVKTGLITVTAPVPLVAGFTATPLTGMAPLTVQFTDTSTGGPLTWTWHFGDGAGATGYSPAFQNPTHTYTAAGTYTVELTVRRGSSVTDTVTKTGYITVTPTVPLVAAFTRSPFAGAAPLAVNFYDTSTGSPTSWAWDFGELRRATSTERNPTHTYSTPGTYTATLTVTRGSETASTTHPITVRAAGAMIDLEALVSVDGGTTWLDADTAPGPSVLAGSPVKWRYVVTNMGSLPFSSFTVTGALGTTVPFLNPTLAVGESRTATISTTAAAGQFAGTASVSGSYALSGGTFFRTVTDTDAAHYYGLAPPGAAFVGTPLSGTAPLTVQFTDLSTGTPTDRTWSFGDGSTDSTQTPSHTYTLPGTYDVSLTVGNTDGYDQEIKAGYITVKGSSVLTTPPTTSPTQTITDSPVKVIPGTSGAPRDLNGDGKYDDVNGNGRRDFADVVLYFNQMTWISANEPVGFFDYNLNGRIDFSDAVWLFNHL